MDKLKLDYKKASTFEFTNPPIVPGEVYIGKKSPKSYRDKQKTIKFKLFYIPPELLYEPEVSDDYVWGVFVPIKTHTAPPYRHREWKKPIGSPCLTHNKNVNTIRGDGVWKLD